MIGISPTWLTEAGAVAVMEMLAMGGHRAWFVGGCVRDAIIGRPVSDIDITTDAHPERVQELAKSAGMQVIPTGVEHGTVTVMSGRPFEITTLRRDVRTDGRRAVVAFANSIEDDAMRRDLTMNAIYADSSGHIFDPVGGLADLELRKLRFIGDPEERIQEDYLRSLRYFRFYAWYGRSDVGPDPDALAAISANLAGIDTVSKERIGSEVLKLLAAPDPAPATAIMASTGVLGQILPGSDAKPLGPLVHLEGGMPADPVRRLAVICAQQPSGHLRLSRAIAKDWTRISSFARDGISPSEAGYRLGKKLAIDAVLVKAALLGTEVSVDEMRMVEMGSKAEFPIKAADLKPLAGLELGKKLRDLEAQWIASNFLMSKQALLS